MPPTFSILLPTIGRGSLTRTLTSIRMQQLIPGDEVLLAIDANSETSKRQWEAAGLPGKAGTIGDGPCGDWGHTPRNIVMARASGDYLLSIDDDDAYLPDAFRSIRKAVEDNPGRPHIFKMRRGRPYCDVLWSDRTVRLANVSTQMIVVPNAPEKLGVWGNRYEGDFDFLQSTLALYPPDSVVFSEALVVQYGEG